MAISWGAWEYSSGNGMRVGIEVTWEAISHSESVATATIKIYTENQYQYSDGQTLNYGGSIGGSTSFTNDDGSTQVLRATKTYDYTYSSSSYGSSPGSRTFTATLSGAYNGVTPSKSVTSSIPARPYAAPDPVTSVALSRVSDTSTKISWVNHATSGEPYESLKLQRSVNGGSWANVSTSISGSATSYTNGTSSNWKIQYQVQANNDAGSSAYTTSGYIYTTPAVPASITAALGDVSSPTGKTITWSNSGMGYSEYGTDIIGYKNGVSQGVVGQAGTGVTTFNHTTASAVPYTTSDRWKYTVRHRTTSGSQGTLYSAETGFTNETAGVTSPPNPPTGLDPNGGQVDPTFANPFKWTFNSTDSSDQSKFTVRHRVGAGSWTTVAEVASSTKSWTMPANTYANGQLVEWQVKTKGAATTGGPTSDGYSDWSASAFVTMFVTKKIPATIDLGTGSTEVDLSGYDWKEVGASGQPAFLNGWGVYDSSGSGYAQPAFCRLAGRTELKGMVKDGTVDISSTGNVFVLPEGYRPLEQRTFITSGSSNSFARVDVYPSGDVRVRAGSNVYVSFDGIIFRAEQ